MSFARFLRIPGTTRAALASIIDGSGTLSARVLPITPLGLAAGRFLERIRSLVLVARSNSIETAINVAQLKKQVDLSAARASQQRDDALALTEAARRVTQLSDGMDRDAATIDTVTARNLDLGMLTRTFAFGAIEGRFDTQVPVMALSEAPTLSKLADRLIAQLRGDDEIQQESNNTLANIQDLSKRHGSAVSQEQLSALAKAVDADKVGRIIH